MRLTGMLTEVQSPYTPVVDDETGEAVPWWRQNLPLLVIAVVVTVVGLYEMKKRRR